MCALLGNKKCCAVSFAGVCGSTVFLIIRGDLSRLV